MNRSVGNASLSAGRNGSRSVFWYVLLFCCCLGAGILIRVPALNYGYVFWDEHDYIAHNIYARETLGHFEIPYSNKWPLAHGVVYLLTRLSSSFSIPAYRIAAIALDAAAAALIGLIFSDALGRRRALM